MKRKKRLATDDEITSELRASQEQHGKEESFWAAKLAEAEADGYMNETCGCGKTFLAYHHMTTCRDQRCPFSTGVSVLEMMAAEAGP